MPHMNLQKMECCVFLYALHKSTKNILYLYELSLCPTCVPKDTHMIMSYINQQKSWHVLRRHNIEKVRKDQREAQGSNLNRI